MGTCTPEDWMVLCWLQSNSHITSVEGVVHYHQLFQIKSIYHFLQANFRACMEFLIWLHCILGIVLAFVFVTTNICEVVKTFKCPWSIKKCWFTIKHPIWFNWSLKCFWHLNVMGPFWEFLMEKWCLNIIQNFPTSPSPWYKGMYAAYSDAIQESYTGAAQYEARVPIANAHTVLISISSHTLFCATFVIPPKVIWWALLPLEICNIDFVSKWGPSIQPAWRLCTSTHLRGWPLSHWVCWIVSEVVWGYPSWYSS